jgi:hypothetical protein
MAVKLSYHRWHERAGRCLQLLWFPPLDHTINPRWYIEVTTESYGGAPIHLGTGGKGLLSMTLPPRVAHRINGRRWSVFYLWFGVRYDGEARQFVHRRIIHRAGSENVHHRQLFSQKGPLSPWASSDKHHRRLSQNRWWKPRWWLNFL